MTFFKLPSLFTEDIVSVDECICFIFNALQNECDSVLQFEWDYFELIFKKDEINDL